MRFAFLYLVPFFVVSVNLNAFEKVTYSFSKDPIDVVIPCHPKDVAGLNRAIQSVKNYVQGVRRIIVISSKPLTNEAEWISEKTFPFTQEDIALEIFKSLTRAQYQVNRPRSRMGWIYQQFLKLFSAYCIPNISSNILIVDSDVTFLRPVSFLQENGAGLYPVGTEHHLPYFEHAARLLPGLQRLFPEHSGVAHCMLFQKPVLDDFFSLISDLHGTEAWRAIARTIPLDAQNNMTLSAMSEYEMYFNFVFARTDQVKISPLRWDSAPMPNASSISDYKSRGYDYVAIHIWNG